MLEELGIKPKRLAGASAGAITAGLMAAGYSAEEIGQILERDLNELFVGWLLFTVPLIHHSVNFYFC